MFSVNYIFMLNITYVYAIITCLGFLVSQVWLYVQWVLYQIQNKQSCQWGQHSSALYMNSATNEIYEVNKYNLEIYV